MQFIPAATACGSHQRARGVENRNGDKFSKPGVKRVTPELAQLWFDLLKAV